MAGRHTHLRAVGDDLHRSDGLPTFALQVGIARTAPLTAQVIRALGPVCVFALQQYDHRLSYSWPTLACIIAYSIFTLAANVVHGWRDGPAVMVATAGAQRG